VLRKELYQQFSTNILCKGSILICFKFNVYKKRNSAYTVTLFYFRGAIASDGLGRPYFRGFTITLRHTTLGGNPQNELLVQCGDLYLTTLNIHDTHPYPCRVSNSIPTSKLPQTHERFSQTLLTH